MVSAVAVSAATRMTAGPKTSLKRPAKGGVFRGAPEAEDTGSIRHDCGQRRMFAVSGGGEHGEPQSAAPQGSAPKSLYEHLKTC
jgi:hypothetical protein